MQLDPRAMLGALVSDRYVLQHALGDGPGALRLFRATDSRGGGRVVRLALAELSAAGAALERAGRDLAELARAGVPNVPPLLDQGSANGAGYLVTEDFDAQETLRGWIDRHRAAGRLPSPELVEPLFDAVCAALAGAHAVRGASGPVVHRALRPESVALREFANGREVRVTDFGLAHFAPDAPDTSPYAAPEQSSGERAAVAPWTDVFALAVLLVEMLTVRDRPAGTDQPFWSVARTHPDALRGALAATRADVPAGVWDVLARALRGRPGERFADAGELRTAVRLAFGRAGAALGAPPSPHPSRPPGALPPTSMSPAYAPPPATAMPRTEAMPMGGFNPGPFGAPSPTGGFATGAPPPSASGFGPPPGSGSPPAYNTAAPHGAPYGGAVGAPPPASGFAAAGPPPAYAPGAFGSPAAPARTGGWIVPAVLGVLVIFAIGIAVAFRAARRDDAPAEPNNAFASPGVAGAQMDATRIPVGVSPVRGTSRALVTIVAFEDFQCPFCGRVEGTLAQLQLRYGDELRVVWKNNPLPFHTDAMLAAEAAMEAHAQGRFWQMHDVLFQNQRALSRYDLERYAITQGLDLMRFRNALDMHVHQPAIQADMALARTLGATGTPSFYINGTQLTGAQPLDRFTNLIDQILVRARMITPRETVYAQMVANPVVDTGAPPSPSGLGGLGGTAPPPRPSLDSTTVYNVPVTSAQPARGRSDALVTLVMFGDFQCPFCARAVGTLEQLRARYGDELRIVWRNNPLPFHPNAMPAAEAAMEALAQRGYAAFWRFHDALYASQRGAGLARPTLERIAIEQGLDLARFRAALDDHRHEPAIRADIALASRLTANGTPSFFVNGRSLVGAQPLERFTQLIEETRGSAEAMVRSGVPRSQVYLRITSAGANAPGEPARPSAGGLFGALR